MLHHMQEALDLFHANKDIFIHIKYMQSMWLTEMSHSVGQWKYKDQHMPLPFISKALYIIMASILPVEL